MSPHVFPHLTSVGSARLCELAAHQSDVHASVLDAIARRDVEMVARGFSQHRAIIDEQLWLVLGRHTRFW